METTPAIMSKYSQILNEESDPEGLPLTQVSRLIGADWHRLARALNVPDADIRSVRQQLVGREAVSVLRIWHALEKENATRMFMNPLWLLCFKP